MISNRRVLTGMRTTGQLHLGHYVGALKLWKEVQNYGPSYECFFLLADVQALTTHADDPAKIKQSIHDVTLDWLSVGLDPRLAHVNFVLQSAVPSRFEISQYLTMLATINELKRNPTVKSEMKSIAEPSLGFISYPVDQTADVEMICPIPGPDSEILVPVGEDQVPHLEYSRKLARRFNKVYGAKVLIPCRAEVGRIGRLVGINGTDKMSKSKDNAIYLADSRAEVLEKVMRMYTDPNRKRASDPGRVEGNPLFIYFDAFASDLDEVSEHKARYEKGLVGDVQLKRRLAEIINDLLEPMRQRRAEAMKEPWVDYVLDGSAKTQVIAQEVVGRMKQAMSLDLR